MRGEIFIYEILLLSGSDIGLKPHQFPIKALHNTQLSLYQNIYIYIYIYIYKLFTGWEVRQWEKLCLPRPVNNIFIFFHLRFKSFRKIFLQLSNLCVLK